MPEILVFLMPADTESAGIIFFVTTPVVIYDKFD